MRNDDGNCIYLFTLHPFYKIKSYKKYRIVPKKSNTLLDNNIYAIFHIKYTITKNLK
jgi:hypothetical protein